MTEYFSPVPSDQVPVLFPIPSGQRGLTAEQADFNYGLLAHEDPIVVTQKAFDHLQKAHEYERIAQNYKAGSAVASFTCAYLSPKVAAFLLPPSSSAISVQPLVNPPPVVHPAANRSPPPGGCPVPEEPSLWQQLGKLVTHPHVKNPLLIGIGLVVGGFTVGRYLWNQGAASHLQAEGEITQASTDLQEIYQCILHQEGQEAEAQSRSIDKVKVYLKLLEAGVPATHAQSLVINFLKHSSPPKAKTSSTNVDGTSRNFRNQRSGGATPNVSGPPSGSSSLKGSANQLPQTPTQQVQLQQQQRLQVQLQTVAGDQAEDNPQQEENGTNN